MPASDLVLDPGDPRALTSSLSDAFRDRVGRQPEGVYAAPGRVNLIGEHVDYNGGRCLPYALPHSTYVAAAARTDDLVTVHSLQMDQPWQGRLSALGPGEVSGWVSYIGGVLWALREDGIDVPGLDLVPDSRVPVGAGLSSSAALECSVALAACDAAGVDMDDGMRRRLIAACIRAENDVAGASTGGMDQSVSVLAEAGHALLLDFADGSHRQVPWDPDAAGLGLLVIDTRVHHSLSDGGYASRRDDCEAAARLLGVEHLSGVTDSKAALAALDDDRLRRRARHVVTELARVDAAVGALDRGDVTALGELFNGSHASLRDDFEVSCDELDAVVETSVQHGALGARMTGGGFGGSAIALVPEDRVAAVEKAVVRTFQQRDWAPPGILRGAPGPGARRLA
ncbi:MAG: galactokinase [Nocardioides sp.]